MAAEPYDGRWDHLPAHEFMQKWLEFEGFEPLHVARGDLGYYAATNRNGKRRREADYRSVAQIRYYEPGSPRRRREKLQVVADLLARRHVVYWWEVDDDYPSFPYLVVDLDAEPEAGQTASVETPAGLGTEANAEPEAEPIADAAAQQDVADRRAGDGVTHRAPESEQAALSEQPLDDR